MSAFNALRAIQIAESRLDSPISKCGSAILCIKDARSCYDKELWQYAYNRALDSLSYSVGIFSPTYAHVKNF